MCYNLLNIEDLLAGGVMIQAIADFIVEIFKKYGMETLISFVLAIITITVIPITSIDILPFEKQNIYWALLFAVVCWIIIVDALRRFIGTIGSKTSNMSYNKKRADRQAQEMFHKFWNEVDQLSERDRKYLMQFINNENTPISCIECNQEYGGLFHSNWVDKTEKRTETQIELIDYRTREKSIGIRHDTHIFKLKDEIYDILKLSYKKHGRIGNFKEYYS